MGRRIACIDQRIPAYIQQVSVQLWSRTSNTCRGAAMNSMRGVEGSSEDLLRARGYWAFGDFELDPETLELRQNGDPLPMEPLPARILCTLVARANQLVSRKELRELGWPKLPQVADDSLNTCIRQIRDSLSDRAQDRQWIETLRGRGYRFSGEVSWHAASTANPAQVGQMGQTGQTAQAVPTVHPTGNALAREPRNRRWLAPGLAAAGVALILSVAGWGTHSRMESSEVRAAVAGVVHRMEVSMDPVGALPLADEAVRLHPRVAEVHAVRATVLMMLGDREGSWAATGRAMALDSRNATALRVAGNLHLIEGAWTQAEGEFRASLESDPDAAQTWVSLAFARTIRGDFAEGERALNRALEIDPLSPLVLGDAGILYLWANRPEDALVACARAYEVEPRAYWAIPCALDAARLAGRPDEAMKWGRRLTGLTDPEATLAEVMAARIARLESADLAGEGDAWALSVAYASDGRVEEARQAFLRAAATPGFGVLGGAVDPRLAVLRDDPAFRETLRRLGLPAGGTG